MINTMNYEKPKGCQWYGVALDDKTDDEVKLTSLASRDNYN